MLLGIIKENDPRVAITPESIVALKKIGLKIQMVSKSGESSGYEDALYKKQGVAIVPKNKILNSSDIIVSFNPLTPKEHSLAKSTAIFISRYAPFEPSSKINRYALKNHSLFSLDMIPRITIAQSVDVLSSMASIAGYKAIVTAAQYLPRYFPMLTTAAGTIPPAKVLVIGAGVAGLQAVATARRLGAVVEVFDTRSAVKTEVKSLGAKFVEVEGAKDDAAAGGYAVEQTKEYKQNQQKALAESVEKSDVVITTAQLRGKPAPKLISKEMIKNMKHGSVIVDLASSTGGNCSLTKDEKIITHGGITIIGNSDFSKEVPNHASFLFSKNIVNFLQFMKDKEEKKQDKRKDKERDKKQNKKNNKKKSFLVSFEHEIINKSCIVKNGKFGEEE